MLLYFLDIPSDRPFRSIQEVSTQTGSDSRVGSGSNSNVGIGIISVSIIVIADGDGVLVMKGLGKLDGAEDVEGLTDDVNEGCDDGEADALVEADVDEDVDGCADGDAEGILGRVTGKNDLHVAAALNAAGKAQDAQNPVSKLGGFAMHRSPDPQPSDKVQGVHPERLLFKTPALAQKF